MGGDDKTQATELKLKKKKYVENVPLEYTAGWFIRIYHTYILTYLALFFLKYKLGNGRKKKQRKQELRGARRGQVTIHRMLERRGENVAFAELSVFYFRLRTTSRSLAKKWTLLRVLSGLKTRYSNLLNLKIKTQKAQKQNKQTKKITIYLRGYCWSHCCEMCQEMDTFNITESTLMHGRVSEPTVYPLLSVIFSRQMGTTRLICQKRLALQFCDF